MKPSINIIVYIPIEWPIIQCKGFQVEINMAYMTAKQCRQRWFAAL